MRVVRATSSEWCAACQETKCISGIGLLVEEEVVVGVGFGGLDELDIQLLDK